MNNPHVNRPLYVRLFLLPILFTVLAWPSIKPGHSQAKNEPVHISLEAVSPVSESIAEIQSPPVVRAPAVAAAPKVTTIVAPTGQLQLNIPSIGINVALGQTGLDAQGHLMVPANANKAAWYSAGPKIGESGTALITGHLDSAAGPGVFFNLRKLNSGDEIRINRKDGSVAVFTVSQLASYGQDDSFPWSQVYSTSGSSALRIITCDGIYNPATGRYSKNLVVYASLARIE